MAFDENRTCKNCLFRLIRDVDPAERCRFNAPSPRPENANMDNTMLNVTRYPRCPGPACGQWESEFEEPEIEEEIEPEELPRRINKDEELED